MVRAKAGPEAENGPEAGVGPVEEEAAAQGDLPT